MMFQVSDVGHSYCKIRDVEIPSSNNGSMKKHPYPRQEAGFSSNNDELPRKKNNPENEPGSSSTHTYTPVFLTQDFTSLGGLKRKCSPKRIISSDSSMGTRFVTFTLAPVDVRHCRLRLPMQFSRENGINKPGKVYLMGNDGSKWLANLLLESRGRMTVGDGWKSFVKANGLKIGESYTLELNWEDTTPVLSLCPTAVHSVGIRAEGECSEASENESLPIKRRSGTEVIKYENRKDERSSWEKDKSRDSSSASQNRFLTLTITPDSLRHGRLRLPLEFMTENSMNRPGDITLLGKDGAKWLASLLLERRGRMCLGKGWKDFAKANGLKTGDSITLESIWEDSTPVLRLLSDRRQQGECSKAREKESAFTEPSSGNRREESSIYPLRRLDSSLVNQNRFETSTLFPEIVRHGAHDYQIGEIVVFRDEGDMMFQVSDLEPRFSEIQNVLPPSSNNDQENIGSVSIIRKERGFSLYDGDGHDQYNIELPLKKKVKKNNPGTEADPSSEPSCFVAHVTASNLRTDALHLPQEFTSSNSPTQIYSSSEKQLATFTLAPVEVRNCRLRLPMQFTRENGINKPGKIYLLGKDGSKWLANLLVESRGRMTLGDGWKSFVKANGLKTGESFTLKLNWEDTTPVLSLCPPESNIDSREGGECSEAMEKEPLPIVPTTNGKEISKEGENSKKESSSWERETNLLEWGDSTILSQNRFLTLTITPDSLKHGRLRLPLEFMTENNMNKPGDITLLGKDGVKWLVSLLLEKRGRMSLGKGWKDFAKANGLKTGDSITFESIWENATPVLSLLRVESNNDSRGGVEMWDATVAGRRCKHRVAVKKVTLTEEMDVDWMQGQLEGLRKASMWCRNVCTFHGVVKMDGSLCLLMDRCFGSVQSEMERNEGRLTLEQILRYGADVARGVAELHAAGVICMNIKPSNLLLDASGNAVVSDYGLAPILKKPTWQKTRPEFDSSKVTPCSTDCVTLSPHYTAPEAWGPVKKLFWEDASGVSPESDAWSFGCTLVEMCTGSTPWDGLSREEIFQAVVKARKVPPQYERIVGVGIPRELWKMIGECLQFKPSKRPTFNAMLATFLRHLQEIPRSPSASPDNGFIKVCGVNVVEETRATNMGVLPDNPINLHRVVLEGDSEGVRNILAKAATGSGGSSVRFLLEAQNSDGQSALHLACRRGSVELVEAILEYGEANVDIVDKDGDPPLVFALAAGSPQCVHVLIKKGANVRSRLREGSGPSVAHVCSYHGQPDCMRELLVAGADPNAVDDEGETVLHRAVTKKYTDCAIVILENGGSRSMAVSNAKGLTPLHMCVSTWNVAVIKRWVEVSSSEEISQAINIPSPVGTALCMAAAIRKDHEKEGRELVQILLAAGADPTAQDAQHGRTALHTAAMANNVELVRVILDAGVNANIRNVHNTIPLHMALARGANACVSLLLESGSDCNIQDDEGDNAFHIAADAAKMIRENLDWLIVMLRRPDAAVDVRNHSGKTVRDFLEALPREWISEDLMEALLKRGVHLSPTIYEIGDWVKFKRGITTPLHGWQGAKPKSVGFVQTILEKEDMIVAFCSGEARVLASEVVKLIPLDRGQHVRLRNDVKEPRFGWRGQSRDSVGTVLCVDEDGILRVGFPGASRGWKADPAEMERVEEFKVGDWVRIRQNLTSAKHGFGSVVPGSMGIVYCVRPDSSLLVELSYLPNPWHCEPEEVEPATPFRIGDRVCVKRSVAEPRYAWGGETHHSVGKISEIENDGLLIIEIPNRPIPWQADPSDMEKIDDFKVGDWVRVKASVSSPKYGWEDITRNSVGVMHSLDEDGDVGIAFCFRSKPFSCSVTDIEKVVPFHVGQEIHMIPSIAQPRLGWSNETPATIGKIMRIDMDGTLSAQVTGRQTLWKVSPGDAELLSGFEVGDWVRSKPSLGSRPSYDWFSVGRDSIAVVHSIQEAGYLELACCFRKGRWSTHYTDLEKIPALKAGQFVHFQKGLTEPRWGWRGAKPDSRGIITTVHADGEVRVAFFGLPGLWKGDPADLEVERMFEVGEWVRLKEGVPSWKSIGSGSVGVVHGVGYEGDEWDGTISVSFCGEQERWTGSFTHLEKAKKLAVGQKTRVKLAVKQPRFGWSGHSHGSIGTIAAIDADGKLRIYTPAGSKTWMLDPSEVETIEEEEVKIGDWVRVKPSITTPTYQWGEVNPSSIGVVHRMEDGDLWVSFCFLDRLWLCKAVEMERIRPFGIGDKVKIKNGLVTPRWGWGMETHASKGHVVGVDANGKLRIKFLWREGRPWIGDPADIVLDEPSG